jgi:hypothetical protein
MDAHLSLLDDVPLLWTNPHMKEHPLPPAQKNDFARRGKARPENNRICRRMETDIDAMSPSRCPSKKVRQVCTSAKIVLYGL